MQDGKWLRILVVGIIFLFIGVNVSLCITAQLEDNLMYSVINPKSVLSNTSMNKVEISYGNSGSIGLVGDWNFDEGTGTIANDQAGKNNYGELFGDTHWTEGKSNTGLEFDGDRDYILVKDEDSLNFADTNQFTLDVWVKWDGTIDPQHNGQGIIHKSYWSGYSLQMLNDGTIYFAVENYTKTNYIYSLTKVNPDEWHQITAIWGNYTQYLLIDGILDTSEKHDNFNIGDTWKPLEFGNVWGWTDSFWEFHGIFDEIKIYDKAIFPTEKPAKPSIKLPNNEAIVNGMVTIWGEVLESIMRVDHVEINIDNSVNWSVVSSGYHYEVDKKYYWDYTFDSSKYSTGPLYLQVRSIGYDNITTSDIVNRTIHIDNYNILPEIVIEQPIPPDIGKFYYSGKFKVEGYVIDNDNKIERVEMRVLDSNLVDWQLCYLRENQWFYELDSSNELFIEDGQSYTIQVRAVDNELNETYVNYYSPINQTTIAIDNSLPNLSIVQPREGYFNSKFFSKYIGITIVFRDLDILVKVTNPYILLKDEETNETYVDIVINDDWDFREKGSQQLLSPQIFSNSKWNERNLFKPITITVRATNKYYHSVLTEISFLDIL